MHAPWPQPPPQRSSVWIWLGPLLGVVGIMSVVAFVALVKFCGQAAEAGGVLAGNEVVLAWTESQQTSSRVQTARAKLP